VTDMDVCCSEFGRTHLRHESTCPANGCAYCRRFGSSELTCECEAFCGREKCSANPEATKAYLSFQARREHRVPLHRASDSPTYDMLTSPFLAAQ
jgi:hypothetical protein